MNNILFDTKQLDNRMGTKQLNWLGTNRLSTNRPWAWTTYPWKILMLNFRSQYCFGSKPVSNSNLMRHEHLVQFQICKYDAQNFVIDTNSTGEAQILCNSCTWTV